jgi:pimeloyl-ACP methyl ester carboxylesterase
VNSRRGVAGSSRAVARQVPATSPPEPTRARYPDLEGYAERDGVRLFWEIYGEGDRTVFLLPSLSIVPSRAWKNQIPYLARSCRVLVADGRGSGQSDRPRGKGAYRVDEFARDVIAVMDATGTERAALVGLSFGTQIVLHLSRHHADRIERVAFLGPLFPVTGISHHAVPWLLSWLTVPPSLGWMRWNPHYVRRHHREFLEWFIAKNYVEPHSTRGIESALEWGQGTDVETLALAVRDISRGVPKPWNQRRLARRLGCPVLVIHGDRDRVNPYRDGRTLARITGGRLETVRRGGHVTQGRWPVQVNLALRDFLVQARERDRAREPAAVA